MATDLKKLAMDSESFEEFHSKVEKHDQLFKQQRQDRFTKQQPKNLKQLASECMTFSEFHQRAEE